MLGSSRRDLLTIDIGVVQEIHAIDNEALLGCVLTFQHFCAIGHKGLLLHHAIAGAGRHVVTIGPDSRARVIGKQRSHEFISVIGS